MKRANTFLTCNNSKLCKIIFSKGVDFPKELEKKYLDSRGSKTVLKSHLKTIEESYKILEENIIFNVSIFQQ